MTTDMKRKNDINNGRGEREGYITVLELFPRAKP